MEVFIEYNPYKLETEFKINNEQLRKESRLQKQRNKRLQYWLGKGVNWEGIIEELVKETNSKSLDITFKGREIDFEDFKLFVIKYKNKYDIRLNKIITKNDNDILKELDEFVKVCKEGPVEELKSEKLQDTYKEAKSSEFKISVIATMSSGKSTLINSLIGYELLPSKNQACTATIARIKDNDDATEFTAECRDRGGNIVYKRKAITLEDIEKYNDDKNVTYIDMEGEIPGIVSKNMNLVLLDTPGPNNSRNANHGKLTESIINDKNKGVVLYVINATQFGINDDSELMQMISDSMKRGGKQSKDRFLFAINKCDDFDIEKGDSIKELLDDVREYLSKYGIEDPNLFPISARAAKLIRMKENNCDFSRKELRQIENICDDFNDLEEYHFEKLSSLSESSRKNIMDKLRKSRKNGNDLEEALIHTGVPSIEETINEYLEKYAIPIKINEAIREFKEIIEDKKMKNDLDKILVSDTEAYKKVREQIKDTKKKLETGEGIRSIKEQVENLKVDDKMAESIRRELRIWEGDLSDKYYNNRVEKEIANREIEKFKNDIKEYERKYKISLNRMIKENVLDEGERLVEEYYRYIQIIQRENTIKGFNFEKLKKFQEVRMSNIQELIQKNTEVEDIYETRRVENSDKKWYKPWTWLEPKYYDVTEKVGEKEFVDIRNIVQAYIGEISVVFNANIDSAKEDAYKRIYELKKYFNKRIEELNKIMLESIEELNKRTENEKVLQKDIKKTEEKINFIDEVNDKLIEIMNF